MNQNGKSSDLLVGLLDNTYFFPNTSLILYFMIFIMRIYFTKLKIKKESKSD